MTVYIEDLVAVLEAAGERAVLRRDDVDTTGSELLATIRRTARHSTASASAAVTSSRCWPRTARRRSPCGTRPT